MTDDEVLNLPGWGRPDKITRSKAGRMWHEEWLYDRGRLRFENARLASITDHHTLPEQTASLAVR